MVKKGYLRFRSKMHVRLLFELRHIWGEGKTPMWVKIAGFGVGVKAGKGWKPIFYKGSALYALKRAAPVF